MICVRLGRIRFTNDKTIEVRFCVPIAHWNRLAAGLWAFLRDVKMQMWDRRIARTATQTDGIPLGNRLIHFYQGAVLREVDVSAIGAVFMLHNDNVRFRDTNVLIRIAFFNEHYLPAASSSHRRSYGHSKVHSVFKNAHVRHGTVKALHHGIFSSNRIGQNIIGRCVRLADQLLFR